MQSQHADLYDLFNVLNEYICQLNLNKFDNICAVNALSRKEPICMIFANWKEPLKALRARFKRNALLVWVGVGFNQPGRAHRRREDKPLRGASAGGLFGQPYPERLGFRPLLLSFRGQSCDFNAVLGVNSAGNGGKLGYSSCQSPFLSVRQAHHLDNFG